MIDAVQKIKEASFTGSDGLDYVETLVALDALKSVSEQEPCEDCISRQAVLDITGVSDWFESSDSYNDFVIAVCELPPVTPKPKTDTLEKIRAEIEHLEEGITSYHNDRPWVFKDEVLQIIDKYKAESEVQE